MSPELRELFEIKQEAESKKTGQPASQNVANHLLIRLGIIIAGTIAFGVAISESKGWDGLGLLILMAAFHAVWLLFIIIETAILQSRNKFVLRNINLIFILILLLIYGIGGIFLFGFA
ncbi:hypothetical protein [Chryseobacterium kwangjuense]|uniref:Uncharacterized protein n=1 Tax=Chryseobacterium kwangjuense TaxID=267125 RepID=A0A135WHU6_9FLAO|nr:hypothetical protein [Chryseobacterium kwangjuense]KXH84489.1 hypothetical protein AU378_01625 [Chryseobacterium kwangjuense]